MIFTGKIKPPPNNTFLFRLMAFCLAFTLLFSLQSHRAKAENSIVTPTENVNEVVTASTHQWHTVTSVGRKNISVRGIKSKNKLLAYTIPDKLMETDPKFAALMMEADKYIGYPFVLGAANPKDGFDCSGFVSWVFIHSGVYNTGRRGANGLHNLCKDIEPEQAKPGDLIFFQKTMGPDEKGITHVGIYVGNNMMIHAGDPVGFADLTDPKWVDRFYCYGRLPIEED